MERQNQNEMVCAQSPINSENDGERENHIDDGERPAATTNEEDGKSRIYEQESLLEIMGFTMALVSCSRARLFSRNRRPRFTHDNDENEQISRQSKQSTQKWLDNDCQDRQTTANNQQSTSYWHYLRSIATRLCKCHHRSCSTRGEIDALSLHANGT